MKNDVCINSGPLPKYCYKAHGGRQRFESIFLMVAAVKADGPPQSLYSDIWLLNRFPIKYPSFIYLHGVVTEIFVIMFTAV